MCSAKKNYESLNKLSSSKNANMLDAFVEQAEFQQLRAEFEKILDVYLEKSKMLTDDELPHFVKETIMKLTYVLCNSAINIRSKQWANKR